MLEIHGERHLRRISEMNIIAVIVLYNDATEEALSHVGKIAKQVNTLCLVDNSSTDNGELFRIIDNAVYIPLLANKGIAAAQNVGIDYAISHQADFIYFADPDSQVPDDAVDKLLASYQGLSEKNISVGGIGSMARDKTTQKAYPLRSNLIREHKEWGVTEVGYIMNSSSLIPIKLFQTAGKMDERLFIDGVDCEFCWRASYLHGYRFFITPNVVIDHQLGMGSKKIGGKYRSLTPPFRMYYQYRNFLWLRHYPHTPRAWVKENRWRYLAKMVYYPLFKSPRLQYIKNIYKGIKDGIKNSDK